MKKIREVKNGKANDNNQGKGGFVKEVRKGIEGTGFKPFESNRSKVEWEPEDKPFFWIKEETAFEEEPIPLKEILKEINNRKFEDKRLAGIVAMHFLKEGLIKEAISVDWNEEELLLAEELIESGTYLFKTSREGLAFKKLG